MGAGNLNERQVDLRTTTTGNYPSLKDYMDGREVITGPFEYSLSAVAAKSALLDSTSLGGALVIAVDAATTQSFGSLIAANGVTIGTESTNNFADAIGNILNRVDIRVAGSNDPISVVSGPDQGKEVFGLIQTDAADGGVVGAVSSENTQISFVYFNASDVLTNYDLTDAGSPDIEFNINVVYSRRDLPVIHMAGGSAVGGGGSAGAGAAVPPVVEASFEVTAATTASGAVLTLATGALTLSGTTGGLVGDDITLPASAVLAYADENFDVELNGISLVEGAQVEWTSTGTITLNVFLDIGDRIVVRATLV